MIRIDLERWCYGPHGTFSTLRLGEWSCFAVEPPWLDNEVSVSCIPEGVYPMGLRRSGIVERTTASEFLEGWEVQDVPQRTYIMLHPGNIMSDTEGCICPGGTLGYWRRRWAVLDSRETFREVMYRLQRKENVSIHVRGYHIGDARAGLGA